MKQRYKISPTKALRSPRSNSPKTSAKQYTEWTQRELAFYENESKFLFVTESESALQKWLIIFSWIISKNYN